MSLLIFSFFFATENYARLLYFFLDVSCIFNAVVTFPLLIFPARCFFLRGFRDAFCFSDGLGARDTNNVSCTTSIK
jgi:hypothetical protein